MHYFMNHFYLFLQLWEELTGKGIFFSSSYRQLKTTDTNVRFFTDPTLFITSVI